MRSIHVAALAALAVLVLPHSAIANEKEEIRIAATAAANELAKRDWAKIYDSWCADLQFHNTWEALFEASFAIETNQQWAKDAKRILSKLYREAEAEAAVEALRKKKPKHRADEEIEIFMNHIIDRRKLWVEWAKVMRKDVEPPPPMNFVDAHVKIDRGLATLKQGKVRLNFIREKGEWKITSASVEPRLRTNKVEQAHGERRLTRPESKDES
jgi:hypothetical protein